MNTKKILSLILVCGMLAGMVPAALAEGLTEQADQAAQEVPIKASDFKTVSVGGTHDEGSYTVNATWNEGGYFDAAVKITNLTAHVNGEENIGYWCGASIPIPEQATGYKWLYKGYTSKGATSLEDLKTKLTAVQDVTAKGSDTTLEFYMTLDRDNNNWVGAQFYKGQSNSYEELGAPVYINMHKTADSSIACSELTGDNLCIAPIVDQGSPAATGLYKEGSYKITPPSTLSTNGVNEVKIEVEDLKSHLNAESTQGHWVGLSVKAPDNAAKMFYSMGTSADFVSDRKNQKYVDLESGVDGSSATGIAFYANASAEAPNVYGFVQFYTALGERISDPYKFHLNLSGVKLYKEPTFSATIDTRGNANLTATPFTVSKDDPSVFEATVSGTVDMRTYVVADKVLQGDFESLLAATRTPPQTDLLDATTIDNKYVISPLNIVLVDMDFQDPDGNALATSTTKYTFKQVNPGMGYAYTTVNKDGPKSGIKEGTFTPSSELSTDGYTFILGDNKKAGAISEPSVPADEVMFQISYEGGKALTTFIIHNEITFKESDAPAADTPVVEVTPTVKDDGTVSAEVESNAVTEDKVSAAANAAKPEDKVLTIDASNASGDIKTAEITLKNGVVNTLAGEAAKDISTEIKTPVGTVTLPAEAAKQIQTGAESSDVKLSIKELTSTDIPAGAKAAYAVEVTKATGGGKVDVTGLKNSMITLSFYIGPNREAENPQLYYVKSDAEGNKTLEAIQSDYNNTTGYITGWTSHLSDFALITLPVANGGLGKEITVTASAENNWVTVQVSKGGANAIYTVQAPSSKTVTISAPNNSTVTVWETSTKPTFNTSTGEITTTVIHTQTVTLD